MLKSQQLYFIKPVLSVSEYIAQSPLFFKT